MLIRIFFEEGTREQIMRLFGVDYLPYLPWIVRDNTIVTPIDRKRLHRLLEEKIIEETEEGMPDPYGSTIYWDYKIIANRA